MKMSHFTVGVLVHGPVNNHDEAVSAVEGPLEPFNENSEAEPYEVRMDEDEVKRMLNYYRRSALAEVIGEEASRMEPQTVIDLLAAHGKSIEREDLVDKMEDWCGNEGGIDEEGMWHSSTCNPDSKWDWYEVGGRWRGMLQGEDFKPVAEILAFIDSNTDPEITDKALTFNFFAMLAGGEWLEKGEMGAFAISSGNKSAAEWKDCQTQAMRDAVAEDPDCVIVVVDCHI